MKNAIYRVITFFAFIIFSLAGSAQIVTTVAGTGSSSYTGFNTPATAAGIPLPTCVLSDKHGSLYVANNERIFKIDTAGIFTLIAGNGTTGGYAGEGGPATAARLPGVLGLKLSRKGELHFITESNRICKIDTAGIISTVGGDYYVDYSGDGGPVRYARFDGPMGLCFDTSNNLFIADMFNNVVRKVDSAGIIRRVAGTTEAGYNGEGLNALYARVWYPISVAVDGGGSWIITESFGSRIRKVTTDGIIHSICGSGFQVFAGDSVRAVNASVYNPDNLNIDDAGNIFFIDHGGEVVRQIRLDGIIRTFAGQPSTTGFSGDGGVARHAVFNGVASITLDEHNDMYIADYHNNRIRKVTRCEPVVGPLAGAGDMCLGSDAVFTDATTGGLWASSDTNVVAVTTGGLLHAAHAGSATIFYSKTNSCGTTTVVKTARVVAPVHIDSVSGDHSICRGSSTTLTAHAAGVYTSTWNSSNNAVATLNAGTAANTAVVWAVDTGGAILRFTTANVCGTDTAYRQVHVLAAPDAGLLSGVASLCAGDSTYLHSTVTGGWWHTTSVSAIADSATGKIRAVSAGTAIITYSVSNGACTVFAMYTLTINATPSLTTTLTPAGICSGQLFNYVPSGNVAGITFNWHRDSVAWITNGAASGMGNPSEILYNNVQLPVNATYIYTLTTGSCINIQPVVVAIYPIPVLSADTSVTVCSGVPFTISLSSATPGASVLWSRPYIMNVLPGAGSGYGDIHAMLVNNTGAPVLVPHTVTVTANGCSSIHVVDVLLSPLGGGARKITTHSPPVVCTNSLYNNFGTDMAAPVGTTYHWRADGAEVYATGSNGQYCLVNFNTPGLAGIYLDVSDSGAACPSRDTFMVYVSGNNTAGVEVTYNGGEFACLDNNERTYQWGYDDAYTLDSFLLGGATNQTYFEAGADLVNKLYWVITTHNGCSQKNYYRVPAFIQYVIDHSAPITIAPNPTSGIVNVHFAMQPAQPASVIVSNVLGHAVYKTSITGDAEMVLPAELPGGTYVLTVCLAGGRYNFKLLLQR